MNFWNGNKSPARQSYELEILETILASTRKTFGPWSLTDDRTDYPKAEDEGNIFNNGADLLVTVAGNTKFDGKETIVINQPIAKGLLGKRILIVKQDRLEAFAAIDSEAAMKRMTIGIPATWVDADLFRANGYPVVEKGSFEDIFSRLKEDAFDYIALGANEIEEAYNTMARPVGGLAIEPSLMLTYPFPLVFLVNPLLPELAHRITAGLDLIRENGQLDTIFEKHYGTCVENLALSTRRAFRLTNPHLPDAMRLTSPGEA